MEKNKKNKPLTYIDVSKDTGLSLGTISRYFNNGSISKKSKKIIEEYIKKHNFTPNVGAQIIRGHEKCIYMIIPKLSQDLSLNNLINSVITLFKTKGINSYIVEGTTDINTFIETINETILRRPKNIIIFPPAISDELIECINNIDINVLVYGYSETNKKSIIFDKYTPMKKMTTKIIDNNDGEIKKILYFGVDETQKRFGKQMYHGFLDAVKGRGIDFDSYLIPNNSLDEIRKAWSKIYTNIDNETMLICGTHTIFATSFLAKEILNIDFKMTDICGNDIFDSFKSYDYKIYLDLEKITNIIYNLLYSSKNSSISIDSDVIRNSKKRI